MTDRYGQLPRPDAPDARFTRSKGTDPWIAARRSSVCLLSVKRAAASLNLLLPPPGVAPERYRDTDAQPMATFRREAASVPMA
jgi:hypothetical protein